TIDAAMLGTTTNRAPDAFEAALLDAQTLSPLTQTTSGLGDTDAFLNVQSDGTFFVSPQASIHNLADNGGILGATVPRVLMLDVSKVPANTLAVVSFDLLGFGAAGSAVTISDITLMANAPQNPIAVPDSDTTPENTPKSIAVLQNDSAPSGTLDPTSV